MSQGFTKGIPIDTDGTLSANSDFIVPSQKAVKTYVDNHAISVDGVTITGDGTPGNPLVGVPASSFDYTEVLFTQIFS